MGVRTVSTTILATCNGGCHATATGTGATDGDARDAIRDQGWKLVRQSLQPYQRAFCPACEAERQTLIRAGVLDCTGRVLDSAALTAHYEGATA